MLQIANACLRINQGNVQGLLSDECSSPDYGKWENSCRHQMCSFAALRVVGDWAGKFGASIQSGKAGYGGGRGWVNGASVPAGDPI